MGSASRAGTQTCPQAVLHPGTSWGLGISCGWQLSPHLPGLCGP